MTSEESQSVEVREPKFWRKEGSFVVVISDSGRSRAVRSWSHFCVAPPFLNIRPICVIILKRAVLVVEM